MTSARAIVAAKSSISKRGLCLIATVIAAVFAVERLLAARSLKVDFAGFAMVQERRYMWLILIQAAGAIGDDDAYWRGFLDLRGALHAISR